MRFEIKEKFYNSLFGNYEERVNTVESKKELLNYIKEFKIKNFGFPECSIMVRKIYSTGKKSHWLGVIYE